MDGEMGFAEDGRDLCRYRCEAQAYQALHAHRVCREQTVPYLHGLFENFDPTLLGDHLKSFQGDKTPPNAILLEYRPNAKSFESAASTISPEPETIAIEGLQKKHDARVIHNDNYPKNVLVVPQDKSQRAVWVDFDVAIVFPAEGTRGLLSLPEEDEWEMEVVKSRMRKLVRCLPALCILCCSDH